MDASKQLQEGRKWMEREVWGSVPSASGTVPEEVPLSQHAPGAETQCPQLLPTDTKYPLC